MSLDKAELVFCQGQMFLQLRQEESLDELGNWREECNRPEAFGLVGRFATLQEWYDAAPLPFCWDDDGAEGEVDDCCEKVDACRCLRWIWGGGGGGDVVRPERLGRLGGLDGGGYFTRGKFHSLILEPVEMLDGASTCLGGGR